MHLCVQTAAAAAVADAAATALTLTCLHGTLWSPFKFNCTSCASLNKALLAVIAPMQVLLSQGISEDDLETELEDKLLDVDRMRTYDEGVNSVLVASAADEIAALRSQIDHQADEIEQLKDRWAVVSPPVWEAE